VTDISTGAVADAMEGRPTGPHPVVGLTYPFLGGPFAVFETATMHGLAWVRGMRIDILMMAAYRQGDGHGGHFLAACMAVYRTVGVWEVWNPTLAAMLRRRGFVPATLDTDPWVTGYLWTAP
jgi:hypothetical protein